MRERLRGRDKGVEIRLMDRDREVVKVGWGLGWGKVERYKEKDSWRE